jgi:hypothetical protein
MTVTAGCCPVSLWNIVAPVILTIHLLARMYRLNGCTSIVESRQRFAKAELLSALETGMYLTLLKQLLITEVQCRAADARKLTLAYIRNTQDGPFTVSSRGREIMIVIPSLSLRKVINTLSIFVDSPDARSASLHLAPRRAT